MSKKIILITFSTLFFMVVLAQFAAMHSAMRLSESIKTQTLRV